MSSLLLGGSEELSSLTQLSTAIDVFCSYCAEVKVDHLQRLITKYCGQELNEVFEAQGSYVLSINENEILQVEI